MNNTLPQTTRRRRQIALTVLVLLIVLVVGTPMVRASLSAWLGLSVAPSTQVPITAVTLVPPTVTESAAASMPATAQSAVEPDEVYQLSAQVGWEILTPDWLPDGYHFESAYLDENHQMVVLTYLASKALPGATDPTQTSSQAITLLQAKKNDFIPMQVASNTDLTDIQVNDLPGVFATGAWDSEFVPDDQDPSGGQMVSTWRSDLPVKNLYWQVGDTYLTLVTADESLSQQDLIDLADSIGGS